jgi:exopolysaccharide biosynthesis protein
VGGFFTVLRDGSITENAQQGQARHPRSAAGLSRDGSTLYLLVVDGRQFGSIGATEAELAAILNRLGACDGLNFDGGGSTALALRVPDGNSTNKSRIRVVNTPIHNHIPGWERAVATCLGIRLIW